MLIDAKASLDTLSCDMMSPHPSTALMTAAKYGHHNVTTALMTAKADVQVVSPHNQRSALHYACELPESHPIVSALIDAGAKLEIPTCLVTPLDVSISFHSKESTRLLLAAGAKVKDSHLDCALSTRNHDALARLVEAKVNVNSSHHGESLLNCAIVAGNDEGVKILLSAGAKLDGRDKKGYSLLHTAVQNNDILMRNSLNVFNLNPESKRIKAELFGTPAQYLAIVKMLIEAKADLSAKGPDVGLTPLMYAAAHDKVQFVDVLLAAGVNPNETARTGDTSLTVAVAAGSVGCVRSLVAAKASLEKCNRDGLPPLTSAIQRQNVRMVKTLIDLKADVNFCHGEATLIELAMTTGSQPVVHLMRQSGALFWWEYMAQKHAFLASVQSGINADVVTTLKDANQYIRQVGLVLAVRSGHRSIVQTLLSAKVKPSCTHAYCSPLIAACTVGDVGIVEDLVDAGADFLVRGVDGMTATQAAAKNRHRSVVELLVRKAYEQKKMRKII
jgi:ankyrin repeat protein